MTQVFDEQEALERVEGDWDFYVELVGIFFNDYDSSMTRLRQAIEGKKAKELESTAHSIKGALANLSAKASREVAFQLEKLGKGGNLESGLTLLNELDKQIQLFREQVEKAKASRG